MANDTPRYSVGKCVTCKRCGADNVTWNRSRKGSFYLTNVVDGTSARNAFHSATDMMIDGVMVKATCVKVAAPVQPQSPKCEACTQHATERYEGHNYCKPCYTETLAMEDAACNEAEANLAAAEILDEMGIERQDPVDTLISANKDILAERLNALFKASPDRIEITDHTTGTITQSRVIPVTDEVIKGLDAIANNTLYTGNKPLIPRHTPAATPKPTVKGGQPRNIPCPKCKAPNRLTYAELVAKPPITCC